MNSIVSVFNYQSIESLEKLLFSSTKDVIAEKILIDDSGTKAAKNIAEKYGWNYISNEKPEGIAVSTNKGVNLAKNEKIFLIDPDTYCPKESIEKLSDKLNNPNISIVGPQTNEAQTWTYQYNNKAPKLKEFKKNNQVFEEYAIKMKNQFGEETKNTRVSASMMGFKKRIWKEFNGFDETMKEGFFEDTDFISKVMKKYNSILCKGVFVHHGGYSGRSRTIFQGFKQGAKLLANASCNILTYAKRHGLKHTMDHTLNGIYSSITGYNTISSEVKN